ncbi:MAG TPA: AMP-binding protein [Acidimicrobiales bacterium]|nr:AMP-binding protein [Acidimicrobiales bacterium]
MTVTAGEQERSGEVPDERGATLPAMLLHRADTSPEKVALRSKRLGVWKPYTWKDYAERAATIAMGLETLGVGPGDRVAVHSENRPAWVLADLGIQGLGAITVGIYPTSPATEVEYLLSHSGAKVLIAEDEEQVDKAMEVRGALPGLTRIVVVDPRGVDLSDPLLMTLTDLEAAGRAASGDDPVAAWRKRVAQLDPATPATIVYTSGTTGPPKGAMLSHRNLVTATTGNDDTFRVTDRDEVLSYLPLCHIAEKLVSVINAVAFGYVVNFGEEPETFLEDLREVQPTFFLGVPRVWEKLLAGITIKMSDASKLKRANYRFWMRRGRALAAKRMRGTMGPADKVVGFLAWLFLFRSLREKIGMGRVRAALSGAAPIAPQVLEFYWTLGVPVREGYGQTENTAQATLTRSTDVHLGTVGTPVPTAEVRIAPDGEILTRGPGTFLGYYRNEEATAEALDADGWLHTGDVGEFDENGHLRITDRKKDIIITAGGKNISPSEIENRLKVSPFVKEAIVIGDRRKYLTALIGIEQDTVGNWALARGLAFTTYADLSSKEEVVELVQSVVEEANADFAQVETIKRFALLDKELDQEDGEVTATQKVKRAAIAAQFRDLIEAMYR